MLYLYVAQVCLHTKPPVQGKIRQMFGTPDCGTSEGNNMEQLFRCNSSVFGKHAQVRFSNKPSR